MEMISTQRHGGAAIIYLVGVNSTKTGIILFSVETRQTYPLVKQSKT
jgi:hypothetical protein